MGGPLEPYSGQIFGCVIIDGSNVLHKNLNGKESVFSLQRLMSVQLEVEKLGWPSLVAMKYGTYKTALSDGPSEKFPEREPSNLTPQEKSTLEELEHIGKLSLIHGKGEIDDQFLLKTAIEKNGWILANDRYRLHIKKLEEKGHTETAEKIKERWVQLEFVGNDSTPMFNLPRNSTSEHATKIFNSGDLMKEVVDAYNNVKAVLVTDGLPKQKITLPLREPIGRKFFTEELQSYDDDHVRGISRSHFRIDYSDSEFWITDLDSTNGTYINGMKIPPVFAQQLPESSNPTLRIGNILLQIVV